MQKVIIAASVLLIIQIGLTVALNVNTRTMEAFVPQQKLLEFEPDLVNRVSIEGEDGVLFLQKQESSWLLPEVFSVPADTNQVSTLLDKLAEFKQGLAVATSREAANRFKVSEELFERHLVLSSDDKIVADLYVGTSPGFRQVHVRRAGRDEIVTVALSTFELEATADKWLDKNLVQVKVDDLKVLEFREFSVEKQEGGWQLAGLGPGQQTNTDEVQSLLNKVSGLVAEDVVDPEKGDQLFAGDPVLEFTVTLQDNSTIDYLFAQPEEDTYVLKRSDREFLFKVSSWVVDDLKKLTRDKLLTAPVAQEGEEGKDKQGEGS